MRAADLARDDPTEKHFLIVDEINRGNLAKVFGELYFLRSARSRWGGLSVSIQPKLPVSRVLYLAHLASYAIDEIEFREERFGYHDEPTLVEALVPAFAAAARRAFSRGLLRGYRTEEDSLQTVRGSIRMDDQIRRRFGIPVPLEVREGRRRGDRHRVRHVGKALEVAALDLSGSIDDLHARIGDLASRVRALRGEAVADRLVA